MVITAEGESRLSLFVPAGTDRPSGDGDAVVVVVTVDVPSLLLVVANVWGWPLETLAFSDMVDGSSPKKKATGGQTVL